MATIYHNCDHNDRCLAMISITDDTDIHYFRASDETGIADLLCMKIGDVLSYNGIPTYIEASSWCPLASIGEVYEDDAVTIRIVCNSYEDAGTEEVKALTEHFNKKYAEAFKMLAKN